MKQHKERGSNAPSTDFKPGTAVHVIHKIAGLLKGVVIGPKNPDGTYTVDIEGDWHTINERFLSEV